MTDEAPCGTVLSQTVSSGMSTYSATLNICGDAVEVTVVVEIEIQFRVLSRNMRLTFRETVDCVVQPSATVELPVAFNLSGMKIPDDVDEVTILLHLADRSKPAILIDCGPDVIAALEAAREPIAGEVKS